MFLTSFNVYFVFDYACFMRICLKTAIWLFLAFLGQGLAFFGENRLATLVYFNKLQHRSLVKIQPPQL